jgi:hypothetical protein
LQISRLPQNQEVLPFQDYVGSCKLAEYDAISNVYVEWNDRAILQTPAIACGDDLALLWFFFSCVRDDDSTRGYFLLLDSLDEHAVVKWSDRHKFPFLDASACNRDAILNQSGSQLSGAPPASA